MKRRRFPTPAALLLAACVGADPASDADHAVTVPADAVQVLATPDIVARVVDLQPTPDDGVWVLNSIAPYFVVLAPDGRLERRFGERGGGPEEFGQPLALVPGPDPADVWTYDFQRSALIRISGDERREMALSRDSIPVSSLVTFKGAGINAAPPWLQSTDDGFVVARVRVTRHESALHLWNADILLLSGDDAQASVGLHTPLADLVGDPASRFGDASILLPYPLWTVCADGTVGLYDPLANTLRRLAPGGDELGTVALPEERRVQMTADLVFELFYRQLAEDAPASRIPAEAEMRRLTEEQNLAFVAGSADAFPEYSELLCGPDGTLWLRLFDVANGRLGLGSNWLRVSEDGSRTSVALPTAFRAFRIGRDRIWGTLRDALGVESIAWVALDPLQ